MDKKVENLINEQIRAKVVLVIDENKQQLGKMDIDDALQTAYDKGLDLVCVAPDAETPVCKIMDYQKYRYDQQKKLKEAKKNQKVVELKEIRISPTIDVGDFETKAKAAIKFLSNGDKCKVSCRFRGRMIEQAENTKALFYKFFERMGDIAQIDSEPTLDGRNMSMMLSPKVQKKK